MSKLVLVFDIYNNDKHLGKKEFDQEAVALGSGPQAALQIEDDAISPLHAVFNVTDSVVKLVDLGAGGLLCNGEPINSSVEVKSGDKIEIQGFRLELTIKSADSAQSATAEPTDKVPVDATEKVPVDTKSDDNTDESAGNDETEKTTSIPSPAQNTQATQPVKEDKADSEYPDESDLDLAVMEEEAPLDFVMGFSSEPSQNSDTTVPQLLEVAQIYGNDVFDVKHFPPRDIPIHLGPETGFRLRFAGLPVAWVPKGFAKFGWLMYPFTESHEEWKSEFYAPLDQQVPLFEFESNTAICTIQKDWEGFVTQGEERFTIAELVEKNQATKVGDTTKYTLGSDTRIVLNTGFSTYFAQLVPATKKIPAGLIKQVDYPFLAVLIFIGALFGALTVMMMREDIQELDVEETAERLVQVQLEEQPEPEEEEKPDANPDAGEGAKAKKEEGKVGKKDAAQKEAKGDKRIVEDKVNNEKAVSDFMSDIDMGLTDDSADPTMAGLNLSGSSTTLGGALGAKGNQFGSGGLGTRGGGIGGGGTADGLGGMGSKGTGRGSSGYGTGSGSFGKKKKGKLGRIGGSPIILGSLDKSLIDKVIKKNMRRIRYCYQRQLSKNPTLGGKVKMKFTIGKTGSVSSAKVQKSTIGSSAVDSCLKSVFRTLKFPAPKGGGIVIVKYPFIFGT